MIRNYFNDELTKPPTHNLIDRITGIVLMLILAAFCAGIFLGSFITERVNQQIERAK